jgi:hypothetical protein
MLAKLLQEEQPQAVAEQYIDSLDEQFFWTANTYLAMVGGRGRGGKAGSPAVAACLLCWWRAWSVQEAS